MVSAGASAVVGITGILIVYAAGTRQTRTAITIAGINTRSAFLLLSEQHRLGRLSGAYSVILQTLIETQAWALMVYRTGLESYSRPDRPAAAEAGRTSAKIQLGWSVEVQRLYAAWEEACDEFERVANFVRDFQKDPAPHIEQGFTAPEVQERIDGRRDTLIAADQDVRQQITSELNAPARYPDD